MQKIFEVIGASWGVEGRRERRNREGASRNLRKLSLESEPNFVSLSRGRDKDGATVGRLASPYVPSLSLSPRRIVDRREGRFRSVSFRFVSVESRRVDNYLATNTSEEKRIEGRLAISELRIERDRKRKWKRMIDVDISLTSYARERRGRLNVREE